MFFIYYIFLNIIIFYNFFFFFSSRRRHTRCLSDWSSDVCSSDLAWLGMQGVRELVLVSENSTSYGKDLPGGTRALVRLLPRLKHVPGIDRVRVSYLQP